MIKKNNSYLINEGYQNNTNLFETLAFYMYFKQINRIVSLQSCALDDNNNPMVQTPNNDYECRVDPLFHNVEDKMWDNLKYINNNKLNNRSIELLNYVIELSMYLFI